MLRPGKAPFGRSAPARQKNAFSLILDLAIIKTIHNKGAPKVAGNVEDV
jgi:hypothetical protein